jgi:hypothetical protein
MPCVRGKTEKAIHGRGIKGHSRAERRKYISVIEKGIHSFIICGESLYAV